MTSRVEELQRMCDNINENGGLDSGEWHTALLAQIAQNLAVIADVMLADRKTEPTISKMEQVEEPKAQTETQNSNLTFKTLEYCDICDHKGCAECIANDLDEYCIPSQFKKQIEDECAKEYEELGLKELKELIKADRKTENSSEKPNNSKVSEKPTGSERSSE